MFIEHLRKTLKELDEERNFILTDYRTICYDNTISASYIR